MSSLGKVRGIGGVFFKCKDPEAIRNWYAEHLGMTVNAYGSLFQSDPKGPKQYLQWSPFADDTKYFEPSKADFMINYLVDDLDSLLNELADKGIEPVGEVMRESYGLFAHIMDPEGNKIELWQPIHKEFEKLADSESGEG